MTKIMDSGCKIAGYCRISVDEELDKDNTSIENQKEMIDEFVGKNFPASSLTFYEDRDRSGYTFEQREGYQRLRTALFNGEFNILIVKDFSRFSRRNSLGLYELETLRDADIRIISIGDNVDFPKNDDWLNIQFRFLMNEMPVTDTSKKVRNVVKMRQSKGEWICNAPYGYYIHPLYKNKIFIDEEGAEVVRLVFDLYNKGWGYKKIAGYLTDNNYPTGIRLMINQLSERGADTTKLEGRVNNVWSHVSVSKMITNDFYVGTLRQGVWKRKGINKADKRTEESEHIVFEDQHEPLIDKDVFTRAQENYTHRSTSNYKGVRKYENTYGGFLFCEDCKSPMFSISNPHRPNGYICGSYHRRGLKGCSSHHIHESTIDESIRAYITSVRDNLKDALIGLDIPKNENQMKQVATSIVSLNYQMVEAKLQLKASQKQRLRQILSKPENETLINETFDELEKDYISEIKYLESRVGYLSDETKKKDKMKSNINEVLEVFDKLIHKGHFTKQDVGLIINKIWINCDKVLTIELKSDIIELFHTIQQ